MNANEILDMIGDAKSTYVWDAQQVRGGNMAVTRRKLPVRKMWLTAAIIAMLLMLAGCAIAYVMRLQDMKVGEYSHYVPTVYDEDGNVIPAETPKPITLISLQGVHMEAMAEWVAFTEDYDRDRRIALEAENTGAAGDIPAQYALTYGCYTQEMVDRLNDIAEKYALKLLSASVPFGSRESRAVFEAQGIQGVFREEGSLKAEYLDGYFYPEGTFELNASISMKGSDWRCQENLISYRYSVKDYFDPVIGAVSDPEGYTQWDHTRSDGIAVLLAMNESYARIYANLPDAFVSVSMEACEWEAGGRKVPMTKAALEQIADMLDLSIRPAPADGAVVSALQAEAGGQPDQDSPDMAGYGEIVEEYRSRMPNPENGSYLLYDLNGDGVEELILNGWGIYSMKDGEPYPYIDLTKVMTILPMMRPCEGNILEIYTDVEGFSVGKEYYFYRAEQASVSYIIGVTYNANTGIWHLIPDDDPWTENDRQISAGEAQQILDSYTPVEFDWRPLKKYGEPYTPVTYTDPYARYIANRLERFENAVNYTYALVDLNDDGVEELITRDAEGSANGREYLLLRIHTIRDGELWDMNMGTFAYVCEGGILEETLAFADSGNQGEYWQYYRCTAEGAVPIEKIVRDPSTLVWGRVESGKPGRDVTEAEALSVVNSYQEKRMELDMKPFTEYPFS